jgi:hypothetical protein
MLEEQDFIYSDSNFVFLKQENKNHWKGVKFFMWLMHTLRSVALPKMQRHAARKKRECKKWWLLSLYVIIKISKMNLLARATDCCTSINGGCNMYIKLMICFIFCLQVKTNMWVHSFFFYHSCFMLYWYLCLYSPVISECRTGYLFVYYEDSVCLF